MRLDKFLADNSAFSRSQIKKLVKEKRVTYGGEVCTNAALKLPSEPLTVCIDDEVIAEKLTRYILLNKPPNYICSTVDETQPSVLRLFPSEFADLKIVGRLDADTTGVLLLTDDGQWLHRVINPSRSHGKTYLVTTDRQITQAQLQPMTEGMLLRGETSSTKPAKVEWLSDTQFLLTIYEGKYHQVKRMCAALGFYVSALHRTAVGEITLSSDLSAGEWRPLTEQEIAQF